MRKFGLFGGAALILAGLGWIGATTQARIAAPSSSVRIDVEQITKAAGHLPADRFVDYSLVYE
jgi:hypothetical protein